MAQINLPTMLFLNGPPRSGKTTLSQLLSEQQPSIWTESFMEPIRQALLSIYFPNEVVSPGFSLRDPEIKAKSLYEYAGLITEPDRDPADIPSATIRDAMVTLAESQRSQFGEDIFGRLALKRCADQRNWYSHFIIDDAGYSEEAKFIVNQIGAKNCALVRIHRAGFEFRGDNRNYLSLFEVRTIDLHNDGPPDRMLDVLATEFGPLKERV